MTDCWRRTAGFHCSRIFPLETSSQAVHWFIPVVQLLGLTAGVLPLLAGCQERPGILELITGESGSADRLRVATSWPVAERERLESEFRAWMASPLPIGWQPITLVWVDLSSALSTVHPEDWSRKADVLLGGPLVEYARLARDGGSRLRNLRRACTGPSSGSNPSGWKSMPPGPAISRFSMIRVLIR